MENPTTAFPCSGLTASRHSMWIRIRIQAGSVRKKWLLLLKFPHCRRVSFGTSRIVYREILVEDVVDYIFQRITQDNEDAQMFENPGCTKKKLLSLFRNKFLSPEIIHLKIHLLLQGNPRASSWASQTGSGSSNSIRSLIY
jgi:hypothetical protein